MATAYFICNSYSNAAWLWLNNETHKVYIKECVLNGISSFAMVSNQLNSVFAVMVSVGPVLLSQRRFQSIMVTPPFHTVVQPGNRSKTVPTLFRLNVPQI